MLEVHASARWSLNEEWYNFVITLLMKIERYPCGSHLGVFPLCRGTSRPPLQSSGSRACNDTLVVSAAKWCTKGAAPDFTMSGKMPSGPGALPLFTFLTFEASCATVGTAESSIWSAGIPRQFGMACFNESLDSLRPPSIWANCCSHRRCWSSKVLTGQPFGSRRRGSGRFWPDLCLGRPPSRDKVLYTVLKSLMSPASRRESISWSKKSCWSSLTLILTSFSRDLSWTLNSSSCMRWFCRP